MLALLAALQIVVAQPTPALVPILEPRGRVAKILKTGDGMTAATAYKVKSIGEEYQILRTFGLVPDVQSLVTENDGRAFDMLTAKNPKTGETVKLWFDISSFFGKGF